MLAQLPTPTVSTNGNGHTNAVKVSKPKSKRIAKRSGMPKVKLAKIILPSFPIAQRQKKVEEFKDRLFEAASGNTALLTGCYSNWFDLKVRDEKSDIQRCEGSKGEKHAIATYEAWQRARQMFQDFVPIVLDELMKDIARQIELDYEKIDPLAAADVPAGLRNVDLFELMEHIN